MTPSPEGLLLFFAAIGYLGASVSFSASIFLERGALASDPEPQRTPIARAGILGVAMAAVMHTLAIGVHCAVTHTIPFTNSAQTLSATAWAISLIILALRVIQGKAPVAVSAIAMPAAFLCLFTGAVLDKSYPQPQRILPSLDSSLISLHVIAILFAFGLLILAFGCAVLYLVQHRILKHKQVRGGLFGRLPSLVLLEHQEYTLVAMAFPLLTVGLIAGAIRAANGQWPSASILDLKVLASILTWAVYGLYLTLHAVAHWRGPKANYLLLAGQLVAFLTYFAPSTVHSY